MRSIQLLFTEGRGQVYESRRRGEDLTFGLRGDAVAGFEVGQQSRVDNQRETDQRRLITLCFGCGLLRLLLGQTVAPSVHLGYGHDHVLSTY